MTILLFLVDTSASMAQRNYLGTSNLDLARSVVDVLCKQRSRDVHARGDRMMLLTTEDFPKCVKAGWREGNAIFTEQLRALRPRGRNQLAPAITSAFKFLQLNRAQSGIDNYGCGRMPHYVEPVVLIAITDAQSTSELTTDQTITFSTANGKLSPGLELCEEAFRWDQRLYTVVLRVPAQPAPFTPGMKVEPDIETVERLCGMTGGRSFCVSSHKQVVGCVEQLVAACQMQGVVLRFDCPSTLGMRTNGRLENGGGKATPEEDKRRAEEMLVRRRLEQRPLTLVFNRTRGLGHWPIPEAFWHERNNGPTLPPRKAHPAIVLGMEWTEAIVCQEFPFDKYELEPSPLADYVIEKGNTNQCLQVFVNGSGRVDGIGRPFGYLKAASNLQAVNLFIMPYDYPILLKLLDEQKVNITVRQTPLWRQRLDKYLSTVPPYYLPHLKKALMRLKITGGLLDEPSSSQWLNPHVAQYLSSIKRSGRDELDGINATVALMLQQPPKHLNTTITVDKYGKMSKQRPKLQAESGADKEKDKRQRRRHHGTPQPEEDNMFKDPDQAEIPVPSEHYGTGFQVHLWEKRSCAPQAACFRNPFLIRRHQLTQQFPRLRANMDQQLSDSHVRLLGGGLPGTNIKLQNADELHSQPIASMGNYDEYAKCNEAIGNGPLREVEPQAVHKAFGNPYKLDKKSMAIDEVGEGPVQAKEAGSRKDRRAADLARPRRKTGPLAANSMQMWRERRRTMSERSSIMSDMSHLSDDVSDAAEMSGIDVEPASPILNGFDKMVVDDGQEPSTANGPSKMDGKEDKDDMAVKEVTPQVWGLDEEADDDDVMVVDEQKTSSREPPKKKTRSAVPASSNAPLADAEILKRKLRLAELVRGINNERTVHADIRTQTCGGSVADEMCLLEFALRDSRRFKRKALSDTLHADLKRLRVSSTAVRP